MSDRAARNSLSDMDDFKVVIEGGPRLFNHYGILLVNAGKRPNMKAGPGQTLVAWVISPEDRAAVAEHRVDSPAPESRNARSSSGSCAPLGTAGRGAGIAPGSPIQASFSRLGTGVFR